MAVDDERTAQASGGIHFVESPLSQPVTTNTFDNVLYAFFVGLGLFLQDFVHLVFSFQLRIKSADVLSLLLSDASSQPLGGGKRDQARNVALT